MAINYSISDRGSQSAWQVEKVEFLISYVFIRLNGPLVHARRHRLLIPKPRSHYLLLGASDVVSYNH
jgi:hypothetical protein